MPGPAISACRSRGTAGRNPCAGAAGAGPAWIRVGTLPGWWISGGKLGRHPELHVAPTAASGIAEERAIQGAACMRCGGANPPRGRADGLLRSTADFPTERLSSSPGGIPVPPFDERDLQHGPARVVRFMCQACLASGYCLGPGHGANARTARRSQRPFEPFHLSLAPRCSLPASSSLLLQVAQRVLLPAANALAVRRQHLGLPRAQLRPALRAALRRGPVGTCQSRRPPDTGRPVTQAPAPGPWEPAGPRSACFLTLPIAFRGSVWTNTTRFGVLYAASVWRQ